MSIASLIIFSTQIAKSTNHALKQSGAPDDVGYHSEKVQNINYIKHVELH